MTAARRDPWKRLFDGYASLNREPTSWRFEPLDVDNIEPQPEATLCRRDDGQGLIYPGMSHSFFGDADSMKSFALAFIVREAMADQDDDGQPRRAVMYLDCERNRRTFVRRMASIGTDLEALQHVCAYFRVRDPLLEFDSRGRPGKELDGWRDLEMALEYFDPGLLIIDGVTEFMALHGLDVNDATHVTAYQRLLLRRWPGARTTASADHTAKTQFGRRTALGSQQKRAGLDGASYEVEKLAGWNGGANGVTVSAIKLAKDNEGGLREHCSGKNKDLAAYLRLDSTVEPWRLELLAPDSWTAVGFETKEQTKQAALDAEAEKTVDALQAERLGSEKLREKLGIGRARMKKITDQLEGAGRIERDPVVKKNPPWVVIDDGDV